MILRQCKYSIILRNKTVFFNYLSYFFPHISNHIQKKNILQMN